IIVAPQKFTSLDPGLMKSFTDFTANVSSDYDEASITFWLYIEAKTETIMSKQLVFVRGSNTEIMPYCVLFDGSDGESDGTDFTLEVGVISGDVALDDRLHSVESATSKCALEANQWYHIGIVFEGRKLRLFVNGVLDVQKTLSSPIKMCISCDWNIYLGKLTQAADASLGDLWSLMNIHSGLEGMLAQFRLHTRALSAIHLHILYDQGPPPLFVTTDHSCYQIGILLLLLAQSSESAPVLVEIRWLRLIMWMLRGGTYRVQQLSLRILKQILTHIDPFQLSTMFQCADDVAFVQYLLQLCGLCMWRFNSSSKSYESKLSYDFPLNVAGHTLSFLDYIGDNSFVNDSERSFHLGMEACNLLVTLSADRLWSGILCSEMSKALAQLKCKVETISSSVLSIAKSVVPMDTLNIAAGLGSLSVLGGSIDTVRIGALVELNHGRDAASIVGFDPSQSFVHLAIHKADTLYNEEDTTSTQWVAKVYNDLDGDSLKVVRHNIEELVLAPQYAPINLKLNNILVNTSLELLQEKEHQLSSISSLWSMCQSHTLKALANSVGFPEMSTCLVMQQSHLFQKILNIAISSDDSISFAMLLEMELKARMLRRRQYELNAHSYENEMNEPKAIENTPELIEGDPSCPISIEEVNAKDPDDLGEDENDDCDDEDGDEDNEEDEEEEEEEDEGAVRSELVEELSLMGFPEDWCTMALKHTKNDILSASAWIVDNLEYFNSLQAAKDKEERLNEAQLAYNEEEDDQDCCIREATPVETVVDPLEEVFLEKETGRKVFGEIYFPFEEGGYLSNCGSPLIHNRIDNTHALSSQSSIFKNVQSFHDDLQAMSLSDVLDASLAIEKSLSIQYARQIIATVFAQTNNAVWSQVIPEDGSLLLKYCKSILFRGKQFSIIHHGKETGRTSLEPELIANKLIEYVLRHDLPRFGGLVCDTIVHELQQASDKKYEAYLWTQRDNNLGDTAALNEPSIEYASWLLQCLFADSSLFQNYLDTTLSASETLTRFILDLSQCLNSTNLPLRLVVFQAITYVLRYTPKIDNELKVNVCTRGHVHPKMLLAVARRRHLREVSQNRLYFSPYLQGLLQLIRAVQDIDDTTRTSIDIQLILATETCLTVAWTEQSVTQPQDNYVFEANIDGEFVEWYTGKDLQFTKSGLASNTNYTCRVRYGSAIVSPVFELQTKALAGLQTTEVAGVVPFTLDKKKCRSSTLTFSDDGLSVSYSGNETWRMVLGSEGFSVGRHKWQIRIEKSSSAYLFLGVASKRANLESFLGADENSWGYIGDGALYYQRNRFKTYGDTFGEGDILGLDLDCEQGTLSFSKNGVDLGIAFDNIVGELFPAVAFYSRHQKISLLKTGFECNNGIQLHGSPKDATVDDYLSICQMLHAMIFQHTLSNAILLRAYEAYTQWCNETRARHMTRAGYDLLFDVSDETCTPFGFKARDRVKTPRGNGTVIGVADNRLWIETEGENGCWFFHPTKVRPRQINIQTSQDVVSTPRSLPPKAHPAVNFEAFQAFADCNHWSLIKDAKIINQLNQMCFSCGLSPWNMTQDKVKEVFRTENITEDELERIVCRVAVLKLLNQDLSRTIAFFDLSWHYFARSHHVLFASELPLVKESLFVALKHSLLDMLLEKTLTHPKKAEDDYDYPEDLPQLVVNRPKAAVAHFKSDLETVVSQSLFGQAFCELHLLENKILRMVYSHPMDDGQLRTFKVKFEGEGADDYGGPYREFFSQFMSELQSIKPGISISLLHKYICTIDTEHDGLECKLPFLIPCPNWRNGVGSNRERFVLNPSLLRVNSKWNKGASSNPVDNTKHFTEMYHFLGQILGIILRTKVFVRIDFAASIWKQLVGTPLCLSDLLEIDLTAYNLIRDLKKLLEVDPEAATATLELLDLTFTTNLSDGSLVEIIPNGEQRNATLETLPEYIDKVIQVRLQESSQAMAAIKRGICTIVPANAVALFPWHELEARICGRAEIDIALLQANTEYDEDISANDEFVQRFWRVLTVMSQDDRCAFLRFVSARSRLPIDQQGFTQKFKIQAASGEGMTQNPDDSLPKSHTCFFALLLPKYSTDDICRKQFLYAIHNCLEMDGDFRLADTEMTGWNDVHPNDALRI
ncbi:HECT E3 ubiquitin ligase, partial [Thraustotheca clavata]